MAVGAPPVSSWRRDSPPLIGPEGRWWLTWSKSSLGKLGGQSRICRLTHGTGGRGGLETLFGGKKSLNVEVPPASSIGTLLQVLADQHVSERRDLFLKDNTVYTLPPLG